MGIRIGDEMLSSSLFCTKVDFESVKIFDVQNSFVLESKMTRVTNS